MFTFSQHLLLLQLMCYVYTVFKVAHLANISSNVYTNSKNNL